MQISLEDATNPDTIVSIAEAVCFKASREDPMTMNRWVREDFNRQSALAPPQELNDINSRPEVNLRGHTDLKQAGAITGIIFLLTITSFYFPGSFMASRDQ